MTTSYQPTSQKTMIEKSWSRLEVAKVLDRIAQSRLQWGALTDIAEEYAIPRTTVIHWKKRQDSIDHKLEVVDFFESAISVAFLQQLMLAVTFVLTQIAGGGIRSVCLFLQLSGLDRFAGSSYGGTAELRHANGENHWRCWPRRKRAFVKENYGVSRQNLSSKAVPTCY